MSKVYRSTPKISFFMTFVFVLSLILAPAFSYASYSEYNSNPSLIAFNAQGGNTPVIVTNTANNITLSSATLNGFVDGNILYTAVWFEWSANSVLNNPTRYQYGFGASNYSTTITGLNPGTTYYFRAVAKNAQGTTYGNTYSFNTLFLNRIDGSNTSINPTKLAAITHPATSISRNSADLNALVVGINNNSANSYFEWGTTTDLGNVTDIVSTGALPAVKHESTLNGLSPNTTYYFRAVAENSSLKSNGAILDFTTSGSTQNTNVVGGSKNQTSNKNTGVTSTDSIIPYLGANVIGAGASMLPGSILGWLLLIILALALLLMVKHLVRDFTKPKKPSSNH